jgi:hypothetical protein
LEEAAVVSPERAAELVAFDEALQELATLSERQSRVVELRCNSTHPGMWPATRAGADIPPLTVDLPQQGVISGQI